MNPSPYGAIKRTATSPQTNIATVVRNPFICCYPESLKLCRLSVRVKSVTAVDALDHVVWAVNPRHDTLDGLSTYIAHSATSYLTPLEIACRLDFPLNGPLSPFTPKLAIT